MTIEIKITDATYLSKTDILALHKALLVLNKHRAPEETLTEKECGDIPSWVHPLDRDKFPIKKEETPKKRKNRKSAEAPHAFTEAEGIAIAERSHDILNQKISDVIYTASPPPPPTEVIKEPEISYEDLIAFVLESTRTEKLTFAQTMTIVEKFQIPNLHSIDKFPHLLQPVYEALKQLVG